MACAMPACSSAARASGRPHILSLGFHERHADGLVERLAAEDVYVAPRLGRLRISPHVYNDEADVDRFVAALLRRKAP